MKTLLQKLLPLDRIIQVALKFGLLKTPLIWLGKIAASARGVRTEGLLAISALVLLAAVFGLLDFDQAQAIIASLLSASAPTLLDKIDRVMGAAKLIAKEFTEPTNV